MRRTNKNGNIHIYNVYGDNNNFSFNEHGSRISVAIILAVGLVISATVLAVSYCCPELLADFVRMIISIAMNS